MLAGCLEGLVPFWVLSTKEFFLGELDGREAFPCPLDSRSFGGS